MLPDVPGTLVVPGEALVAHLVDRELAILSEYTHANRRWLDLDGTFALTRIWQRARELQLFRQVLLDCVIPSRQEWVAAGRHVFRRRIRRANSETLRIDLLKLLPSGSYPKQAPSELSAELMAAYLRVRELDLMAELMAALQVDALISDRDRDNISTEAWLRSEELHGLRRLLPGGEHGVIADRNAWVNTALRLPSQPGWDDIAVRTVMNLMDAGREEERVPPQPVHSITAAYRTAIGL